MSATDAGCPLTVMGYAAAVEGLSSGRFMSAYREDGKRFFASVHGAPFFALAQLVPELRKAPGISLLIADVSGNLSINGGRWLSLYAKAIKTVGKITCTVCVDAKPPNIKAHKALLFQPAQQILVKSWRKHLRDLDVKPDVVVVYVPPAFAEMESAIDDLCRLVPGRKALLACDTRIEAGIARHLLQAHGGETSAVLGFYRTDDEPQERALGAWWISVTLPAADHVQPLDAQLKDALQQAHQGFRRHIIDAADRQDAEGVAAFYGLRTVETNGAEGDIEALRVSAGSGFDIATGREFSISQGDASPERVIRWGDLTLSADLLHQLPADNPELSLDENRHLLAIWLGRAMAELDARDDSQPDAAALSQDAESPAQDEPEPVGDTQPLLMPPAVEVASAQPAVESPPMVVVQNQVKSERSRLSRSAGTVNVLALAAMLGKQGASIDHSFDAAKAKILAWLSSKGFGGFDASESRIVEKSDGELSIETDGQAIWSFRLDDRRSMEAGAIWRVEATLLRQPRPAISLRLMQVRSNEEAPPPVASGVPQVVATIAKEVGLEDAGIALLGTAVRLSDEKMALWLAQLLQNPSRTQPVVVISGSVDVSADRLAARLAGVAHVVCIDTGVSDQLIRRFGRDRAVYGHAVRLYRPGFTIEADSARHTVWILKGTQLPKWLATDIFEDACTISLESGDLDERAPSFETVRNHLVAQRIASSEQRLDALRQQLESIASSKDEQIGKLQAIRSELESTLVQYQTKARQLEELADQLQGELQVTRRERDAAIEEVRQLKYQVSSQWATAEAGYAQIAEQVEYPDNWEDLETWVELYGEGRLVLHPKAAKAARESPFNDISLAYKAMDYLVRYYIPMRTRSAEDQQAFQRNIQALAELGLEESDVGTADEIRRYRDKYRRQYDGREIVLDRHLKKGVGFDPAVVFRLYFYYDEESAKVVVGHLTTHLTNRLSHNG